MSNSISVNSVAWRLLIVCNICLLLTVAYLLYDKYKAVNPQKYLLSGVTATAFEGTDEHGMPIVSVQRHEDSFGVDFRRWFWDIV